VEDLAMKKLIKIICIIMVLFVLACLCLYKIQIGRTIAERRGAIEQIAPPEIKTTEGRISLIDTGTKTLILSRDDQMVPFSFDDRTAVSVSGHFVQSATITSGVRVRVRYVSLGNRNWAQEILLAPTQ
jgi:hypothetical protein